MSRRFFTGIFALMLCLAGCAAPAPSPTPRPATQTPALPVPSATAVPPSPTVPPAPPPTIAPPAAIPDPAGYSWMPVVTGLRDPIGMAAAQDGSGRLFVLERAGRIRVIQAGQLLPAPFLDLRHQVGSQGSEQGLLGLAFHPQFAQNGYFYVNYTDLSGNTHVARFTASGEAADPASEKQLLLVQQPFANHNGGSLAFGPDGYLYIGLGDGGSRGDPYGNAQSGNTLLGKLLRLDVDSGDPYAIPPDNPYAADPAAAPEIWALGLRNPWRFSFDRQTGDLWIGDVGQDQWEEVNFVAAGTAGGLNFGWNALEAAHPYNGSSQSQYTAPAAEYSHAEGCSVTGGYVYRGQALPEWQGVYLFGDYCSGQVWGLPSPPNDSAPVALFQTGFRITTFGQDEAGEIYLADYSTGSLYRLAKP